MPAVETLAPTLHGATGELPLAEGVLLASLGGPGSDGAVRLASLFARSRRAPMEVLAVLEPISQYLLTPEPRSFEIDEERRQGLDHAIAAQCRRVLTGGGNPVVIEEGEAAECIASRARARGAALIAMGIGRHDPIDRLLGVEPAIAVLHRTSVPVLAATPDATVPLRSIVMATDFSPAAERAARLALALAAGDATLHFVHAWPWMDLGGSGAPTWFRVYERGVGTLIDEMVRSLQIPPNMRVVTHLRHGEAATVLRQIAHEQSADLIALGSHGRGFFDRLTLGSVAENVLRRAECSVLIAPPTEVMLASRPAP